MDANSSPEKVGLKDILRHKIEMELLNKMRTKKYLKLKNTLHFCIKLFHFQGR